MQYIFRGSKEHYACGLRIAVMLNLEWVLRKNLKFDESRVAVTVAGQTYLTLGPQTTESTAATTAITAASKASSPDNSVSRFCTCRVEPRFW